jgi:type VI secretion system secreted protein Hcp
MAYDAFLDIKDIPGEATAKGFEKKIGVYSFSIGGSAPATVSPGKGGLSGGRVTLGDMIISKQLDASSTKIMEAMCHGTHIPLATLTLRKATGTAQEGFLVYKLSDCMISSIQTSGSSGSEELPHETVSIVYGKIEVEYKTQEKDGKLKASGQFAYDATLVA